MQIKALYLKDFRNYQQASAYFAPQLNVIHGSNGAGKSNLLEALYLFVTGKSFRTPHLKELIRFNASFFYIELLFEKDQVEQTLKFFFDGTLRRILHNRSPLSSLSGLLGIVPAVILAPEDRILIKGGPQARRHFLDLLLAQSRPLYLEQLSRYVKAMKQRNVLLKERKLHTISIWEEQMAEAAAFLTLERNKLIQQLTPLTQERVHAPLVGPLELLYRSSALVSSDGQEKGLIGYFLEQFAKYRSRECELGTTLSGPHRDDVTILLQEKEARRFASEGQQYSCLIALKLAQWKWLQNASQQTPLLCIDDMGMSLDKKREAQLYEMTRALGGQIIVTSSRSLPPASHAILISQGVIQKRSD